MHRSISPFFETPSLTFYEAWTCVPKMPPSARLLLSTLRQTIPRSGRPNTLEAISRQLEHVEVGEPRPQRPSWCEYHTSASSIHTHKVYVRSFNRRMCYSQRIWIGNRSDHYPISTSSHSSRRLRHFHPFPISILAYTSAYP